MLFWRRRRLGAVVSAITLAVLAGCTSTVAPAQTQTATSPSSGTPAESPSGSSTPTPSATWDAEQIAAIDVVTQFAAADDKIGSDPSAYSEEQMKVLLKKFSGGEALAATVRWHLLLKENGYRLTGEMVVLSTAATKPTDGDRGTEVHITQCQDQRQGKVVDKDGNPVAGGEFQIPAYNLRQFSIRKPPGEAKFRVFGFQTINGRCP